MDLHAQLFHAVFAPDSVLPRLARSLLRRRIRRAKGREMRRSGGAVSRVPAAPFQDKAAALSGGTASPRPGTGGGVALICKRAFVHIIYSPNPARKGKKREICAKRPTIFDSAPWDGRAGSKRPPAACAAHAGRVEAPASGRIKKPAVSWRRSLSLPSSWECPARFSDIPRRSLRPGRFAGKSQNQSFFARGRRERRRARRI